MIGRTLSHFRILAKIGEGGMGVVYRAVDERLRRQVALKVLPLDLVADEERRRRFLREARAAAAVTHPNIATIHEIDEADDVVFIAMELVEGKTLRSIIGGSPLPIRDTLRIATQIAEGLARAHDARVIHRDLKPDNVIVGPDGHVKLLDFGLSKILRDPIKTSSSDLTRHKASSVALTSAGRILGTVGYMSPEQARGGKVDARTDLFAFGITLYEMVTGKQPFQGKTDADTMSAVIRDDPSPPSRHNTATPYELERIIGKCLEKDPNRRPQSAHDVVAELQRLKRFSDAGERVVRTPREALNLALAIAWRRLTGTRAARVATAAGLSAALALGGVGTWWSVRSEGDFQIGDRILVIDFKNETERPELGPAVRDAFEDRISYSSFLRVLGQEELKNVLEEIEPRRTFGMDRSLATSVCAAGKCEGFLSGRIGKDENSYSLEASVFKVKEDQPIIEMSRNAIAEGDILETIHEMSLDLRRELGEPEHSVADTDPPGTRSLEAYQAYVAFGGGLEIAEDLAMLERAIEIDPDFLQARRNLATAHWNMGNLKQWREELKEIYRRSAKLLEAYRWKAEIDYLEASYEFEPIMKRLREIRALNPMDFWPYHYGCLYFPSAYADHSLAENFCEQALTLMPTTANLTNLCELLILRGASEELDSLATRYRDEDRMGHAIDVCGALASILRGDEKKIAEIGERAKREWQVPWPRIHFVAWLTGTGRLTEAWRLAADVRQAIEEAGGEGRVSRLVLIQAWLAARQGHDAQDLLQLATAAVRANLRLLPQFAALSVDLELEEPLSSILVDAEVVELASTSTFVRDAHRFAEGCLKLIQGEAQAARRILEPLSLSSELPIHHRVLARAYEALGMWRQAAGEYEQALQNPHLRWGSASYFYLISAVQVLEQFRLARIYERLGNTERARHWYGRFLEDWKNADPDIPELIQAKERLANLNGALAGKETETAAIR